MEDVVRELQAGMARMQAVMEQQQAELMALRQSSTTLAEQHALQVAAAAEERRNLIGVLAQRTAAGNDEVVDGKGVGHPPKLTGRRDDFAEWTHKCRTFLVAKLGDRVGEPLKWAQQQRKNIVSSAVPGEREVSYYAMFGQGAGQRAIADIEKIESRISTYMTSFTSGDANKVVRNVGEGRGLESWRRLHAEYDPTSSMRRVAILGTVQNPPRCEKIEELGKALSDWLERKRQYEDFTDEKGEPCRVSSDSLMAAMYKIMPKALR